MNHLPIGGITPFSTMDCPDTISAVFYLQGCHFKCGYCHNREFQQKLPPTFPAERYLSFLKSRQDFLECMVFSGGEPFCQENALTFMARNALDHGYKIAIHTTGSFPEALARFIDTFPVHWVGIDLKGPKSDYPAITGQSEHHFDRLSESIHILKTRRIPFETRTTIDAHLSSPEKLKSLIETYRSLDIQAPVLQTLCNQGKKDPAISSTLQTFITTHNLKHHVTIR